MGPSPGPAGVIADTLTQLRQRVGARAWTASAGSLHALSGAIDEALERANDRAALEALGAEILARRPGPAGCWRPRA